GLPVSVKGYTPGVGFSHSPPHRAGAAPGAAWPELADKAVAQTLPRTVNTGMGALFVLIALAVLGGDSLTDFSIALLVGVVAGMASTVFTAMPIAVGLQHRYPDRPRSRPTGTKRKDRGTGAVV
ncbi:hypothetical protein ACFXN5_32935, partial [Streptomyces sp. NPDC059155]